MAEGTNGPGRSGTQRAAALLFAASALGEIGIGVILLAFPQVAALLLDASLDATGLLVVRGLGGTVLALGLTWWIVRNDARALAYCTAGFIIYNVVVGACFVFQALRAAHPALPWFVGIAHLLAGGVFAAAIAVARLSGSSRSSGRSWD
ncbi:MAG TPA: hypothetical protein VJP07_06400 [Dehalococcoidia bacterium]|nr:hypothetical protein [Dehalococcoidia bacterium]